MVRRLPLLMVLLIAGATAAPAQQSTQWELPTEFSAATMAGQGLAIFCELVADKSENAVRAVPSYDAKLGIKSADMVDAVRDGRVLWGDVLMPQARNVAPILGLSGLPFLARTADDARRLAELARPGYVAAFQTQGLRLLFVTPWPASGLWTKAPLRTVDDFKQLSIRAYDDTSAGILRAAGARAQNLSFADAMPKLASGAVNAVLSSGDGGAGRRLWEQVPHFTEINYTFPMSAAVMNEAAFAALSDAQQKAILTAAAETELRLWDLMRTRLAESYARMAANGAVVSHRVEPELAALLRTASAVAISAWRVSSGREGATILDRFQAK